jgi:geranylgeranyl pyrophosphate synthase
MKTGALITASAKMGCICANADYQKTNSIVAFASAAGEAFQITDDILDVCGDSATLGKPVGSDEKSNKNTYITTMGRIGAKDRADILFLKARAALQDLYLENSYLPDFIDYIAKRTY